MSDHWDFYFCRVNDTIASIFVDLGLRKSAPDPRRPWLLWCWVHMQRPLDDGLSCNEEAPTLHQIEDALKATVHQSNDGEMVGRITTDGRRELYYYALRRDGFEQCIEGLRRNFPRYTMDFGTKHDPDWNHYTEVLSPGPEDIQRIRNRHVIEVLKKEGDLLAKSRPISHWAYFKTDADRAQFVDRISNDGFQITHQSKTDKPGDGYPLGVQFERIDFVDWQSINDITIPLFRGAKELGGQYDGWETSVEKD